MIEVKVGKFLREHIPNIIELCQKNEIVLNRLINKKFCTDTFYLKSNYSLLMSLDEIEEKNIYNRFYVDNHKINDKSYRVCSQFGGNHIIADMSASQMHGEKLLRYFIAENILLTKFNNDEIKFIVGDEFNDNMLQFTQKNIELPLNQILYGPPGTGKTYHTIDKALQIIDGKIPDSREEAKERFEALKKLGQIEFITFHQSYGYEEFVEGIKATTNEKKEIKYDIQSGIFKILSEKSLFYYAFKNYILTNIGETIFGRMKITDIINKEIHVDRSGQGTKEIIYLDKFFIIHQSFYKFLLDSKIKNQNKKINFHYKLYAEDILNDKKHDLWLYAKIYEKYNVKNNLINIDNKPINHVVIIDEINRGNISKIFGELITLIEESKRLGNDESMEITLPYSGEKFGVPKNFYIIGTMNTADRSIALMDTALRRRFEFEEMMPKPELLGEVEGIDLKLLLIKINQRIEYLYDRDHTIGHAYFMGVMDKEALDSAMKNKVIPLLQEYFYDDWEKIQIVLGDHKEQAKEEADKFVLSTQNNEKDILGFNYDELDEEEYSYSINTSFTNEAYLKLYE